MYYIPLQNVQLGLFQLQYNFLLLQHWKEIRMNNSTKPYFQYSEVVTVQILFLDKILHNCICFISVYDHKCIKIVDDNYDDNDDGDFYDDGAVWWW